MALSVWNGVRFLSGLKFFRFDREFARFMLLFEPEYGVRLFLTVGRLLQPGKLAAELVDAILPRSFSFALLPEDCCC